MERSKSRLCKTRHTNYLFKGFHMFSINCMRRTDEKGQGLVEYALILVLIAMAVLAALQLVGPAIGNIYSEIITKL